jgi:hypothetical protein
MLYRRAYTVMAMTAMDLTPTGLTAMVTTGMCDRCCTYPRCKCFATSNLGLYSDPMTDPPLPLRVEKRVNNLQLQR